MDGSGFDRLARGFAAARTRRRALREVAAAGLALLGIERIASAAPAFSADGQCIVCDYTPCAGPSVEDCYAYPCLGCSETMEACPPFTLLGPVTLCRCDACEAGSIDLCTYWRDDRFATTTCNQFDGAADSHPLRQTNDFLLAQTTSDGLLKAKVTGTIDGGTFRVQIDGALGETDVVMLGISAPKIKSNAADECYANSARAALRKILTGKTVLLDSPPPQTATYAWGTYHRYVWLEENGVRTLLNETLVALGAAKAAPDKRDHTYDERIAAAQAAAQSAKAGLWGACGVNATTGVDSASVCGGERTTTYADSFGWGVCYDPTVWEVEESGQGDSYHEATFVAGTERFSIVASNFGKPVGACPDHFHSGMADGLSDDGLYADPTGAPVESQSGADLSFSVHVHRASETFIHYSACQAIPGQPNVTLRYSQDANPDDYPHAASLREQLLTGFFFGDPPADAASPAQPTPTSTPITGSTLDASYHLDRMTFFELNETIHKARSRRQVASAPGASSELRPLLDDWGWSANLFLRYEGDGAYRFNVLEVNVDRFADNAAALDWFASQAARTMTEASPDTYKALPAGATGFEWYDIGDGFRLFLGEPSLEGAPSGTRQATLILRYNGDLMRISGAGRDLNDGETLVSGVSRVAFMLTWEG